MKKKILILGSTSWLGSALLNRLNTRKEDYQLITTVYKNKIELDVDIEIVNAQELTDYQTALETFKPNVIVNFLRGENEEGYNIHRSIIHFCNIVGSHYIYASSALALDAHGNIDLTESVLAKSVSEYGIFKANCEEMIYESKIDWTILRFSSLQGYCSHKDTRNEAFLKRLFNGEDIYVDSGVIQNRMFVDDMILIVEKIIDKTIKGIIHIGTVDTSDEIDFLRKQAALFGYNSERIQESGSQRNVNLNCIPSKIHELFGDDFKLYEKNTLKRINRIKEFNKYRKI
jgi:dTDP-4-dehydrorhamnose reductase